VDGWEQELRELAGHDRASVPQNGSALGLLPLIPWTCRSWSSPAPGGTQFVLLSVFIRSWMFAWVDVTSRVRSSRASLSCKAASSLADSRPASGHQGAEEIANVAVEVRRRCS